jgi:hypothetical protein
MEVDHTASAVISCRNTGISCHASFDALFAFIGKSDVLDIKCLIS